MAPSTAQMGEQGATPVGSSIAHEIPPVPSSLDPARGHELSA